MNTEELLATFHQSRFIKVSDIDYGLLLRLEASNLDVLDQKPCFLFSQVSNKEVRG